MVRLIGSRDVLKLTGLSADQLREWTVRRGLIHADIPASRQGQQAQFGWQTVLARLVGFCGAGLYEEVLFRLLMLPIAVWTLERLGCSPLSAGFWALLLSSLLFSGALRKFRDITFLWSHGGGTIPMLAGRIDWLSATVKNIKEVAPDGLEAEFRRFYYDTANAGYAAPMAALLKLAPLSQIVFGTDYPSVTTEATLTALRTAGLSDAQISAIETQNAKQFLPRLRG
jgi:hypothetical protein